jgi:hypothetical protein
MPLAASRRAAATWRPEDAEYTAFAVEQTFSPRQPETACDHSHSYPSSRIVKQQCSALRQQ